MANSVITLNEGRAVAKSFFLATQPELSDLKHCFGNAGWAVILSVDLRGSSARVVRVGAADTYVTVHTYLPTMAFLVGKAGGTVVGRRGDGLFAAFGLTRAPEKPSRADKVDAACEAMSCGTAMLQVVDECLNPGLTRFGIKGGMKIAVVVAVVTRIGWEDAQEVTAYGPPANIACKFRELTRSSSPGTSGTSCPRPVTGRTGTTSTTR